MQATDQGERETVHASRAEVLKILREQFGHESFPPGQERIIGACSTAAMCWRCLTGGGKSLVYQLTAQLLPGVTVVVSPLLALTKDQVESIKALVTELVRQRGLLRPAP